MAYDFEWGDELFSVFTRAYTAKAFSPKFLGFGNPSDEAVVRLRNIYKLYKRLCDLGVTVRKHGYYEYELSVR